MSENKFIYLDSYNNEHEVVLTKDDFKQVNLDKNIHDVKFQSKPTTFFKDAMKRFVKNKSSVIGGCILGVIVVLTIFVPIFSNSVIDSAHLSERFLAPKLFKTGTGFWDGTILYNTDITYDTINECPAGYVKEAVLNNDEYVIFDGFTNNASQFGYGGYIRFNVNKVEDEAIALETRVGTLESYRYNFDLTNTYTVSTHILDEKTDDAYEPGEYRCYFKYEDKGETVKLYFNEYSKNYGQQTFNITNLVKEHDPEALLIKNGVFGYELKASYDDYVQILIENCIIKSSNESENVVLDVISFTDANKMARTTYLNDEKKENKDFWSCTANKFLYKANIKYCHFRYDTYKAIYGNKEKVISKKEIEEYIAKGWCKYTFSEGPESFEVLDEACPINFIVKQEVEKGAAGKVYTITANISMYKYLGYSSEPSWLFGTDSLGKDLLKLIFNGLRTSLLLGIVTSVVNFIIGIIWGAISGYFGGWVDIIMERFTDILGGLPWIVVMTLCILYLGQNIGTFAIALCLTGWMGTASTTRAQFYRFKGREYVLASRTLGSKDMRLIFKHILPNSLGTLVTSSVFMITSVIYTESTLAYLNLGIQGLDSFGVILSENQQFISSNTYLILIPSIVMALMMISFNLFGNGLRDAFNPSLKGSE